MRHFITSDHHFGQQNFHKYNSKHDDVMRPNFSNWEEWTADYIDKHNSMIPEYESTVYFLGDIAKNITFAEQVFPQLNGSTKILVMGNHDYKYPTFRLQNLFDKLVGVCYVFGKCFLLTHIPVHPYELGGMINLHGHLHKDYVRLIHDGKQADDRYVNCCADFHLNNNSPLEIFPDGTIIRG